MKPIFFCLFLFWLNGNQNRFGLVEKEPEIRKNTKISSQWSGVFQELANTWLKRCPKISNSSVLNFRNEILHKYFTNANSGKNPYKSSMIFDIFRNTNYTRFLHFWHDKLFTLLAFRHAGACLTLLMKIREEWQTESRGFYY